MTLQKKLLIGLGAVTLAVVGLTSALAAGAARECGKECPKESCPVCSCPGC